MNVLRFVLRMPLLVCVILVAPIWLLISFALGDTRMVREDLWRMIQVSITGWRD